MNSDAFVNGIFGFAARYRNAIISLFEIGYVLQIVILYIGYRAIVMGAGDAPWFYSFGLNLGEISILLFVLTVLPGICRRFGIRHKFISILMMFRRYVGILLFMTVLIHSSFVWFFQSIASHTNLIPVTGYPLFGFMAFVLLFFLFITSNDLSIRLLGDWWTRIHDLIYIIIWIAFLHVALRTISKWTFIIGITALVETASLIYARVRTHVT